MFQKLRLSTFPSYCARHKLNLHFRKAKALVGNSVTQDFEVCFPAPRDGAIDTLATSIESLFLEAGN